MHNTENMVEKNVPSTTQTSEPKNKDNFMGMKIDPSFSTRAWLFAMQAAVHCSKDD